MRLTQRIRIFLLIGLSFFAVSTIYAESVEEYVARSGKAYVNKPGGSFAQVSVPKEAIVARQDKISPGASTPPQAKGNSDEVSKEAGELNRQGIQNAKNGDPDQAILDFTRAIELVPTYAQAYHNRGLIYFTRQNYFRAIAEYSKAIELEPNYPYPYYDRALVYAALKNYSKTIADCNKLIELAPNFGNAYAVRGSAYQITGANEKALADITKAKALGENISPDLIKTLEDAVKNK